MKSRIIWAAVVLAAIAGFYYATIGTTQRSSTPTFSRKRPPLQNLQPPEIAPPPLPTPTFATTELSPPPLSTPSLATPAVGAKRADRKPMRMEVPIQDNASIDFSIGAPVVRSGGKEQEALDKALKEMAEATKEVSFPPTKK